VLHESQPTERVAFSSRVTELAVFRDRMLRRCFRLRVLGCEEALERPTRPELRALFRRTRRRETKCACVLGRSFAMGADRRGARSRSGRVSQHGVVVARGFCMVREPGRIAAWAGLERVQSGAVKHGDAIRSARFFDCEPRELMPKAD
jgi:hypothetical protein